MLAFDCLYHFCVLLFLFQHSCLHYLYSAVSGPNLSVHANVPFKCNGVWSGTAGKDGEVSW